MSTRTTVLITATFMVLGMGLALPAAAGSTGTADAVQCRPASMTSAAGGVGVTEAEIVQLSHGGCHVSTDCDCGPISCQGQTCSANSNSVTCDDQTTTCPQVGICSSNVICPDGTHISCTAPDCSSGFGCTQETECWVACDQDADGLDSRDFTWCPGFEGCLTCPCGGGW